MATSHVDTVPMYRARQWQANWLGREVSKHINAILFLKDEAQKESSTQK
jgi:hypothetical protein